MITTSFLRELGYTKNHAASIIQKLKKYGCNAIPTKVCSKYVREGIICDYMYFGDGIGHLQAIEALKAYIDDLPVNANGEFWKELLKVMKQHFKDAK